MAIDAQSYKEALARWSSGVTVVTTLAGEVPLGLTISSFTSVSLEPPLVLMCILSRLESHEVFLKSGIFAVNILTTEQIEWGKVFAGMVPEVEDRFEGIDYTTAVTGCPILPGVSAWMDCKVVHVYDGGDHTIFVGEVLAAEVAEVQAPLAYHNRQWGTFTPLKDA